MVLPAPQSLGYLCLVDASLLIEAAVKQWEGVIRRAVFRSGATTADLDEVIQDIRIRRPERMKSMTENKLGTSIRAADARQIVRDNFWVAAGHNCVSSARPNAAANLTGTALPIWRAIAA